MGIRKFDYRFVVLAVWFAVGCGYYSQAQTPYKKHYVVAQDGSGDYQTLGEVFKVCKAFPDERIVIVLKPGIYKEKIEVSSWTTNLSLIGEQADNTVISFDDYSGKGDVNTFNSYTVRVMADGFEAENITFENAASPVGQAVALHVEGDRCVFRNCRFLGNQDTIYTGGENSRQYFVNCYIEGTTDFIFGAATVVFDRCTIHSKKNSYVTAASTKQGKSFGYVFLNCTLTADATADKVYLGRPWRNYAKTVFIHCDLGAHILPEGWHNWKKTAAEKTVFYAEYDSQGEGGNSAARVGWSHQLTRKESTAYTVTNILKGTDAWDPSVK